MIEQKSESVKNLATNLLLLVPGTVWGASFIVVELLLPVMGPFTLTLGRSLISVLVLLVIMRIINSPLPNTWKEWSPFFFLAAMNQAFPFALTAWGQIYIEGGLASILLSVMPLFTMVLAFFFTEDEKLTAAKIAGIGLGLAGIIILIGPGALQGIGANILAQLAIVAAALMYAIGATYIRFIYPKQPVGLSPWALRLRIVTAQFVASALILLPFSLWLEAPWTIQPTWDMWRNLFLLGVGVTGLATITYFFLIEELGASTASTTIYLIPVAGVLLGNLILGEQITPSMIVALGLILLGIFIVNRGRREPARQSVPEAVERDS